MPVAYPVFSVFSSLEGKRKMHGYVHIAGFFATRRAAVFAWAPERRALGAGHDRGQRPTSTDKLHLYSSPWAALVRGAGECAPADRAAGRSVDSAAPVNVTTSLVPGALVAGLWAGQRAARQSVPIAGAIQSQSRMPL